MGGRPFKQLDMLSLRKQMFQWHTASSNVDEIEKLINNGKHYQLACVEYFKSQHTSTSGSSEGVGDFTRRKTKPRMRKRPRRTLQSLSPQCKVPSVRVASVCFSLTGAVRTWGIIRGVSSALNLRAGSNEKRCVQKKKKKKKKKRAPKKKKKKKKKKS